MTACFWQLYITLQGPRLSKVLRPSGFPSKHRPGRQCLLEHLARRLEASSQHKLHHLRLAVPVPGTSQICTVPQARRKSCHACFMELADANKARACTWHMPSSNTSILVAYRPARCHELLCQHCIFLACTIMYAACASCCAGSQSR